MVINAVSISFEFGFSLEFGIAMLSTLLFLLTVINTASIPSLQVPFLDICNTLLHPILPLTAIDYEEFGFPVDHEEFLAIRKYSPYDNIQKDVPYPAVFVTSSFNTRYNMLHRGAKSLLARPAQFLFGEGTCISFYISLVHVSI